LDKKQNRKIRVRLPFILIFFLFVLTEVRLYDLQITRHQEFSEQARKEQMKIIETLPERGIIYDRNLEELAINIPSYSLYARPEKIPDPERVAQELSSILDMKSSELVRKLREGKVFIWLKRKLSPAQRKKIESLHISGIGFIEESKRFYPQRRLASHILGFVGIDNQGLAGLEFSSNSDLEGKKGCFWVKEDALGYEIPFTRRIIQPLTPGKNLVLTIDAVIQSIVEEEISTALLQTKAKSVEALFMDPRTGEILALTNKPDYDPNCYFKYPSSVRKNRVVQSIYEPGSTFKLITASTLLEEGLIDLEDRIYCDGYIRVANHIIHDWKEFNQEMTFIQIIQNSSDVGTIKAASRMKEKVFYKYIRLFGFGDRTKVDLPGEERGIVRSASSWFGSDFSCISIGQGIAVTPLQMVSSLCALVNGGNLLRPYVVKYVRSPEGQMIQENKPRTIRRVISPSTSWKITKALEKVVENGTGTKARIEGYSVGGKTGTSQIPAPDGNGYLEDKHIASFMGFAPVGSPRIAGIVIIKEPTGVYWGGEIAAPVFGRIVKRIMSYLNVTPEKEWTTAKANYLPSEDNLDKHIANSSSPFTMPDLTRLTMSEALRVLSSHQGLRVQLSGSGTVVSQYPPPGTRINGLKEVHIEFGPS